MLSSLSAGLLVPALPMSYKSRFFANLSEKKKEKKEKTYLKYIYFFCFY